MYKRAIRPDELYHWKYKRKYRGPSGDWVYVYDDGSMSIAGRTETSKSTTDSKGNTTITRNRVITNPNRWGSKTVNTVDTKIDYKKGTTTTTVTETVTRGKLHMARKHLERKVSEMPGDIVGVGKAVADHHAKQKAREKRLGINQPDKDYYKKMFNKAVKAVTDHHAKQKAREKRLGINQPDKDHYKKLWRQLTNG